MSFADGALNGEQWMSVVADAVARISRADLEKVVLARDLIATADAPIDVRWPLRRLTETYPMCWTFHVDGMFGATPEMLVRRERGLVTSRVLAGTIRRTGDDERDLALAATLARSSKDLEEHEYAVRSVADALEPHCSSMNVPEAPFVLHLPNVMHLATDVAGVVHDAATVSSLQLAEALHPSAAVGGTPTPVATALIAEIEGMDRDRYAGPVGWMDTTGDGEWGIALRSARLSGSTVRLFAGCGIVADSDPEAELAEAQAKFVPVRDALTARSRAGPRSTPRCTSSRFVGPRSGSGTRPDYPVNRDSGQLTGRVRRPRGAGTPDPPSAGRGSSASRGCRGRRRCRSGRGSRGCAAP